MTRVVALETEVTFVFTDEGVSLFSLCVTAILTAYKTPFKVLRIWRRNGTDPEIL
jgi:hypothetical protein